MAFVSITRLRIRSWRFLPRFFFEANRTARQAATSAGNLATRLLREQNRTFWTATSWRDEAAMRAYMLADPHKRVMRKLLDWCDEASVVHWTQESDALPTWDEAYSRLIAEGRKSKVHHPTPAHEAHQLAAPVAAPNAGIRYH